MSDVLQLDACGQAAAVRGGEVSARELAEAAIARITEADPALNAVSWQRFEEALAEAARFDSARVDSARSDSAPPFAGVPILLKDHRCFAADQETRTGTTALARTRVPGTADSNIYRAIVDAGFVVLGRTTVPEFATAFVTESEATGVTRNPRARDRTPGGSSGGAAAAVAAGMVAVAHATDGGGSIRQPASACGLVGLKPSRGRVSLGPEGGESWAGASVEGVITRSVRDSAAVTATLARWFPGDPYSIAGPALQPETGTPPRMRVGVMRTHPLGTPWPSADVTRVLDEVAGVLADRGHDVRDGSPPALEEFEYQQHYDTIVAVDVDVLARRVEAQLGRGLEPGELAPRNEDKRRIAGRLGATEYLEARYWLATWSYRLAAWWSEFDLLMTPTMGGLPAVVGRTGSAAKIDAGIVARSAEMTVMTNFANIGGLPAISLPLGCTADGIPVGIQFVARHAAEPALLALAAEFESLGPWDT
ncbi:amidase [Mycolicibacterium palauense]|uniref:amidase n=1 Tax=Mycolicibacterium palauense TaxID=2034511 RepID=UPI00159BAADC|nr:amidase [Mycolicibacterium palauense]